VTCSASDTELNQTTFSIPYVHMPAAEYVRDLSFKHLVNHAKRSPPRRYNMALGKRQIGTGHLSRCLHRDPLGTPERCQTSETRNRSAKKGEEKNEEIRSGSDPLEHRESRAVSGLGNTCYNLEWSISCLNEDDGSRDVHLMSFNAADGKHHLHLSHIGT
jgi:hypothetical protein